ncbi:hypothetical protein J2S58_002105 [Nakamurella flavida]|uniref:hypothetical protein n=1 Tax=Nakamurella flavida TaxID=363630 RepID=UPI00278A4BF5|nr:hypothetical protein [Nakamurella flavida]MDP9778482.1 hypothetical protein [Nakamurella flavida]
MTAATTSAYQPTSVAALTSSTADLVGQIDAATARPTAPTTPDAGEKMVLMPAGLFGDLLGGFAGAIGGGIGGLFGNRSAGESVGHVVAPVLKMLPWSVVPAGVAPQSATPGQPTGPTEDLVFVPAGLFGSLLGGLADVICSNGGITGRRDISEQIGKAAAPFLKMLPFSVVPAAVTPQDATPGQAPTGPAQDMVFVPAGFLGDILGGLAGIVGKGVGGLVGDAGLGQQIGDAASPFLKMLPWSVIPAGVTPQSAVPGQPSVQGPDQDLVLVPAGIFGSILGGLGGSLAGGWVGDLLGDRDLGETIGKVVGGVAGGFVPFTVVPPSA